MVIIVQLILAFLIVTVVPTLTGDLLLPDRPLGKRYIMGLMATLAAAQVVFIPFIYFHHEFTPYFIVYVCIIAALCAGSVAKNARKYPAELKKAVSFRSYLGSPNLWMFLALALIAFQVWRVAWGHFFVYADNATYIPYINDLVETGYQRELDHVMGVPGQTETNIKYLFTSYFPYLAAICRLSGLHASILVQTLLPVVLTPVFYIGAWFWGEFFFKKDKRSCWIFLLFVAILVETVSGYDYTFQNHVASGIYFGKKIVFTILLPYAFLFVAERTALYSDQVRCMSVKEVLLLALMMLSICAPSLMGTGLGPLMLVALGLVLAARTRSLRPMWQMLVGMAPCVVMLAMIAYYQYF